MKSEYYYSEKCRKAIANQVAHRAGSFVSDEMIAQARTLDEMQSEFRKMVQDAAERLLHER